MNIDFEKELEDITAQIIEKFKPEKIIVFGSVSQKRITPDSDVDLLIIKKDTPLYGADRIRELSRMIDRNIPVTKRGMGSIFKRITSLGSMLYSMKSALHLLVSVFFAPISISFC